MDVARTQKRVRVDCVNHLSKSTRVSEPLPSTEAVAGSFKCADLEAREARRSDNSDVPWRLSEEGGDVPEVPASWETAGQQSSAFYNSCSRSVSQPQVAAGPSLAVKTVGMTWPELQQQLAFLHLQERSLLTALREARREYDARAAQLQSGCRLPSVKDASVSPASILREILLQQAPGGRVCGSARGVSLDGAFRMSVSGGVMDGNALAPMAPPPPRPPRVPVSLSAATLTHLAQLQQRVLGGPQAARVTNSL